MVGAMTKLAMDILWEEPIIFGGEIMTRREVWACLSREGFPHSARDLFAFSPPALTAEDMERIAAHSAQMMQRAMDSEGAG